MAQRDGAAYPAPFIVEARQEHQQSLILLHGRGSNGEQFGTAFLDSQTTVKLSDAGELSSSATFADVFPDIKFIFPTARKRRAKWYNRATINQWFDSVPIDEQDGGMSREEEEWQLEGLRQSRAFLKTLIDAEASLVGAANVFIGGLSQGCAMSLHVLLSYDGSSPFGGFIGMSGWLPFVEALENIVRPGEGHNNDRDNDEDEDRGFDPFATSDPEDEDEGEDDGLDQSETNTVDRTTAARVCDLVRDSMDLSPMASAQPSWLSTPVFLGHGKSDEKVTMVKGQRASDLLRDIGMQVTWREYDEGHWYAVPDEIDDIAVFIQASPGRHLTTS